MSFPNLVRAPYGNFVRTGKADRFHEVSTLGRASKKNGAPSSRGTFGPFGWLTGS